MPRCLVCSREVSTDRSHCPDCGAALVSSEAGATAPYEPGSQFHPQAPSSPRTPFNEPRYAPGHILADRYRVVSALGKGGMGEVYRADDLRMEQVVALKFLPSTCVVDAAQLARFQKEVRLARQVSHPNVCRVYDVAEHDGQPFLIMEYIDGEDLAKLLLRVGRLSEEKAFQVAREACAAVAAVHDQGLLHLDLKPANIMLDGRGKVRLTDFGLATHDLQATNLRCGTPQYMSPEQLAGGKVSARSDLFGLGLVLYELFTGRSAFHGIDRRSLERPSSHLKTLSPLAEQAILDCLQENPEDRPRSAYEVLAKLPGGDPVAAALALGNTPSPEAVANAPIEARLSLPTATVVLATFLLALVGFARLNDVTKLFRQVPLAGAAPEALAQRATDVAKEFGYSEPPEGAAQGYAEDRSNSQSGPVMFFWHRQSPSPFTNTGVIFAPGFVALPGWVKPAEPPLTVPGMVTMLLDLKGNLLEFRAAPARNLAKDDRAADWSALCRNAGLDMTHLRRADPRRAPPVYADDRRAWDADTGGSPVRIEAAAFRGQLVYFYRGLPEQPDRLDVIGVRPSQLIGVIVPILLTIAFTIGGIIAWKHWRDGRANLTGAWRLALLAFGLHVLAWVTLATHVPIFADEMGISCGMLGLALMECGLLALWYLVLEPFVRRHWPWIMIGWNRLLAGRARDPMVGRDIVMGAMGGVAISLLTQVQALLSARLGHPQSTLLGIREDLLDHGLAVVVIPLLCALYGALGKFFLIAICIVVLRRAIWGFVAAFLANVLLLTAGQITAGLPAPPGGPLLLSVCVAVASSAILFAVLLRFGLLAFVIAMGYYVLLICPPISIDLSAWYRFSSLAVWVIIVGSALYGFVVSVGGRQQVLKSLTWQ